MINLKDEVHLNWQKIFIKKITMDVKMMQEGMVINKDELKQN